MLKTKRDMIFLSYAIENLGWAKRIYKELRKRNLKVWFDKEDLKVGKWKPQILKAINRSRYFIICISDAALRKVGDKPGFQDEELNRAYEIAMAQSDTQFAIVPVRIEDCHRGDTRLTSFQQYDLYKNFGIEIDKLSINIGGISLSDAQKKDERTEEEKVFENLMGKAETVYYSGQYEKAITI